MATSTINVDRTHREDNYVMEHYPVIWQGQITLKTNHAAIQLHLVSGNPFVAQEALPPVAEDASISITQRMRLEKQQLDGVTRKIQMFDEHCILLALPCGKDHSDVIQQANNLRAQFIDYLLVKQAAGIVNPAVRDAQQRSYMIHIFPSCEYTKRNLERVAPDLLDIVGDIAQLVIIIVAV